MKRGNHRLRSAAERRTHSSRIRPSLLAAMHRRFGLRQTNDIHGNSLSQLGAAMSLNPANNSAPSMAYAAVLLATKVFRD